MSDLSLTTRILHSLGFAKLTICMNPDIVELEEASAQEIIHRHLTTLQELEGRDHRIRARTIVQNAVIDFEDISNYQEHYSYNREDIQYVAKIAYIGYLVDLDWNPKAFTTLLIGQALSYLAQLPKCNICKLPRGIYCHKPIEQQEEADAQLPR